MGRPTTKTDLLEAANTNFEKLNTLIHSMSEEAISTPFDFSNDTKKHEAHWTRDKNLRDVYIHLYEWHQLVLTWVASNMKGDEKPFIPLPYNWKTYGDMNIGFWKKHQETPLEDAKAMFIKSHKDIINLIESFSNEELFSKGVYKWVGGSVLGSYFVSSTTSHYDWAIKKLKAHVKQCSTSK